MALSRHGIESELCVWNDPHVDWAAYDVCVLRTTWDYFRERDAFLAWLGRVDAVTCLQNSAEIVRWNSHKSYLVDLARAGFPVAPTHLVPAGSPVALHDVLSRYGWSDVVVKPAVSASSYETHRFMGTALDAGDRHLARLAQSGDVLVQQYLPSVHEYGERSLVFIDGTLTHCARKRPRFHGEEESIEGPLPIDDEEAHLARSLMGGPGRGTLYGRVDLARDVDGRPCLMELELIEPSLFFNLCPAALEQFVVAVRHVMR